VIGFVVSIRSCSRGPVVSRSPSRMGLPGSVARAAVIAWPRSRLGSPVEAWVCRPIQIVPSSRTRPGIAIGSKVHSVTWRSASAPVRVTSAVPAGTISRNAIRSHSAGSPSNGRTTNASAAWARSRP
jgi:hypothetical protein